MELVAGALLDALFGVLFDRLASPEVISFFRSRKLNGKLLKRLKMKLLSVRGVLDDAEGKQIRNSAVKEWLEELKDAAFDADDLLDDIETEAKFGSKNELPNSYEKDIEEIIERLECLFEEKDVLRLQEGIGFRWSTETPTTSLAEESEAYCRDGDKEAIVELLLSQNLSDGKIRVIPIVGMGGIGKSTMAQLVYNDERVKSEFELKAWVSVSEEFDVVRVTRLILEAISLGGHYSNDLNSLQLKLKDMFDGRKFLIVLDDVWNENYDEWCHLKRPFQYGAQGSRIIVTTRSQRVGSIMQTVKSYKPKLLSDEDCWNLFAKHALGYKNSSTNPSIDMIGREIVKEVQGITFSCKNSWRASAINF